MKNIDRYTLCFLPGACSLATLVVLNELNESVELIHRNKIENFNKINPVGSVPVLIEGERVFSEGAAIMLYLLNEHENVLLPEKRLPREKAIQQMMFANATMHPAYGKLFFISNSIEDDKEKQNAFIQAAADINKLWEVVDNDLEGKLYLGGESLTVADIMLSVYSSWGESFPVNIFLGDNVERMIGKVKDRPSYKKAIEAEMLYG